MVHHLFCISEAYCFSSLHLTCYDWAEQNFTQPSYTLPPWCLFVSSLFKNWEAPVGSPTTHLILVFSWAQPQQSRNWQVWCFSLNDSKFSMKISDSFMLWAKQVYPNRQGSSAHYYVHHEHVFLSNLVLKSICIEDRPTKGLFALILSNNLLTWHLSRVISFGKC